MTTHAPASLQTITVEFPATGTAFLHDLFKLLEPLGTNVGDRIKFTKSNEAFLPEISLSLAETIKSRAIFTLSNGQKLTTEISNMTGVEKKPPHKYGYYTL